jgi:adenylate cyclase
MVVLVGAFYVLAAFGLFLGKRYWLPITMPIIGGNFFTHVALVTYLVVFVEGEKKRVKAVFSKLVSPNVVNELLTAEKLNLSGSRRHITVFFSDVRGFTQMTDSNQANAEKFIKEHKLEGKEAEAYFDQSAQETLGTVNLYLATIADQIKLHNGTLDKYMGDCVMAFWGAPTPNEKHAVSCVHAAIDAQRAMHKLNVDRAAENKVREQENLKRAEEGKYPLTLLPLLSLGTGINTGICIVGLMGSDQHILNYTVFGREVNLASRLEGVSGRGRIIIGESTYKELQKYEPELAAKCTGLPPVMVKGIKDPVPIFEVPWRESDAEADQTVMLAKGAEELKTPLQT